MSAAGWYDDARTYDLAFSFPPEREIAFLAAVFAASAVPAGGRILEPMIGTARLAPGLAALGFEVVGFDRSAAMLRVAARKRTGARFFRADAAHFAVAPAFDAAHCLIDSFRYLLREEDARAFLLAVAAALRPGAPFALGLDLDGPARAGDDGWTAERDGATARVCIRSGGPAGPGLEWMDVEVHVTEGTGTRVVRSRLPQRIWTPPAFLALLDGLPQFAVRSIHLRDLDPGRPLDALPSRGGPIVVVLVRRGPSPPDPGA